MNNQTSKRYRIRAGTITLLLFTFMAQVQRSMASTCLIRQYCAKKRENQGTPEPVLLVCRICHTLKIPILASKQLLTPDALSDNIYASDHFIEKTTAYLLHSSWYRPVMLT